MSGGNAVVAIQEERARIGNLEITKETALIATNEGIVAVERHRVEQIPQRPALQAVPPQPTTRPLPAPAPPPEREYPWYDVRGKGCGMVILLLLFYLVVGAIVLPLMVLWVVLICLGIICDED